jgi:hypothetical protein
MSQKSCPGEKFFGGNSVASAKANFYPLIEKKKFDVLFFNGLDNLVKRGVISSPSYWITNAVEGGAAQPQYAASLIIKATGSSDIMSAIAKLVASGAISSRTYWENAFITNSLVNGYYMRVLIGKLGK